MRDAETACQFEEFVLVHGREVFDGLLAVRRSVEGPEWKPRWMDCILYQSKVRAVLRTRFESES